MEQRQIGIMQGRLVPPAHGRIQSFPVNRYRDEFALAAEAGLDCIEWIDDGYGKDSNPIRTKEGLEEIRSLSTASGVHVRSLIADIFIEDQEVSHLRLLLEHASLLRLDHMTLPLVDGSSIGPDGTDAALALLAQILPWAEQYNVELHLETDLAPAAFRSLLDAAAHPLLFVNYDTGNSAALGYDPHEEFAAYGDRIGSLHIKDRVRGGSTVPLGQGDTDFDAVFDCLKQAGYARPIILQVARGKENDEVEWAKQNRLFVETLLTRHGFTAH